MDAIFCQSYKKGKGTKGQFWGKTKGYYGKGKGCP